MKDYDWSTSPLRHALAQAEVNYDGKVTDFAWMFTRPDGSSYAQVWSEMTEEERDIVREAFYGRFE